MGARRTRAAGLLLAVPALLGVAACGGPEPTPSEKVPGLARKLERVDAAVVAGDTDQAHAAVEALVAEAARAEVAGDLTREETERILDAARNLLESLPEE